MDIVLEHLEHVRIQQIVVKVNFVQSQWGNVKRLELVKQCKIFVQIFFNQFVDVMEKIIPVLVGQANLVYP
jgi:hypothetical protein